MGVFHDSLMQNNCNSAAVVSKKAAKGAAPVSPLMLAKLLSAKKTQDKERQSEVLKAKRVAAGKTEDVIAVVASSTTPKKAGVTSQDEYLNSSKRNAKK